jgi:hypothetical protein
MARTVIGLALLAGSLAGCAGLGGRDRSEQAPRAPVAPVQQQTLPPIGGAPGQPPPAAAPGQAPAGTPGQASGSPRAGGIGASPSSAPAGPGFAPMTATGFVGEWTALDRDGTSQCRLSLAAPDGGAPGAATPSGCVSERLFRVARWQSRGDELVLLDERNGPLVMLRPAGRNRYEGSDGENRRFAIWR